ncbi:hypothetical protein DCO48_20080 [Pseudomonas sp. SDI]|uniref:hypothetical protein n=1 Tax=Pseudomonas sp. SDI TaxID=2170734 RepID=UPI000DE62B70|nr:hypothetical protein [Pseudomonas sp. SDI]PWB30545.1 hypothetical protein DCO48_20080 [Pseudomonas sp. SDI]
MKAISLLFFSALSLLLGLSVQAAAAPSWLLAADASNPYNSPIRRANPNSRQGSVAATPPLPGPNTVPKPRLPTLENRGIGNGDTLRREQTTPRFEPTRPARDSRRVP